jgi:hypothetical protein
VKPISQYATLKDFTNDIDKSGLHLPFKVMGKRGSNSVYYSASMLKEVYQSFPDPDSQVGYQSIQTPFGEILRKGCRLGSGAVTYSQSIKPNPKNQNNILQADIVEIDLSYGGKAFPKHKLGMVISHSCGIDNSNHMSIVPVFMESELTDTVVTTLRGLAPKNPAQVKQNWLANENVSFIGLPAQSIPVLNESGEMMLACLSLSMLVPKDFVPKAPKLRLSYRALSYVQFRIALLYIRDVQDSDDTRDM